MPQPTTNDVHFDQPLTDLSVGYAQDEDDFIAGDVFPVIPSSKRSNEYVQYNKGDFFRDEAKKRAPGTESHGSGFRLDTTGTFTTEQYAFHQDIADEQVDNQDEPIDVEQDAARKVMQALLIRREKVWTSTHFTTGVWGKDLDGSSSDYTDWADSSSTPINDIENEKITIREKTGLEPNTLVLGRETFQTLRDNSDILDRIKYTQRGIVTQDLMAEMFNLDNVVVPSVTEDTSAEGSGGESMSMIHTKDAALLCYAEPNPGRFTASAGYTFTWSDIADNDLGIAMRNIRDDKRKLTRIEGLMNFDMKVVAADLGVFFYNTAG